MNDKIRPAVAADVPALRSLVNSAYRGSAARAGWTHEADLIEGEERIDEASLLAAVHDPNSEILIYEVNGALLGCVYLEQKIHTLYLGMLSVSPQQQDKGIGKHLLLAAEAYAVDHELPSVEMTVISIRDSLIQWYERRGYVKTQETRPFADDGRFGTPRTSIEFIVMRKELQNNGDLV